MKRLQGLSLIMLMGCLNLSSGWVCANCGNDNSNGNGCSGNTGPQGLIGPAGNNGANGTNGTNGVNGLNGKDGKNGSDAMVDNSAKLALDTAVRLYDGKRVQVQAFNIYQPSRVNNQDTLGDGRNFMFGARIVFKLGKSYEERMIENLQAQLLELSKRNVK